MIVVKRGNCQKPSYELTCSECQSILRFTKNDKELELVWDERDGDYYKFLCPVCSYEHRVTVSLL